MVIVRALVLRPPGVWSWEFSRNERRPSIAHSRGDIAEKYSEHYYKFESNLMEDISILISIIHINSLWFFRVKMMSAGSVLFSISQCSRWRGRWPGRGTCPDMWGPSTRSRARRSSRFQQKVVNSDKPTVVYFCDPLIGCNHCLCWDGCQREIYKLSSWPSFHHSSRS